MALFYANFAPQRRTLTLNSSQENGAILDGGLKKERRSSACLRQAGCAPRENDLG